MDTRKTLFKLIGIILAGTFFLSACAPAASVAPAPTQAASPLPVLPAATATPVPVATDTPIPTVAATPTASVTATATVPPVAQVIPAVKANCRKGPGSSYDPVAILVSGTAYNVIGRNSLNTWWLVQVSGGAITCWTGTPGTSLVGPVDQAPIVMAQPVLDSPGMFMYSYSCHPGGNLNSLNVTLTWQPAAGATGYHLSRNGVSLAEVGPTVGVYVDYDAPMKVNLVYELEARNAAGSTGPQYVMVPACN